MSLDRHTQTLIWYDNRRFTDIPGGNWNQTPSGCFTAGGDEFSDRRHDLGGLLGVRVVPGLVEQVAAGEDQRFRPYPGAPFAADQVPDGTSQAGLGRVRVPETQEDPEEFRWLEFAVEPAPDQQRHVPAERVAEHGPPFETQPLAQRVGVRRQVEDQGELVGASPERHQRPVIGARPAVREHQRVSVPDDVDEVGHVADRYRSRPSPVCT